MERLREKVESFKRQSVKPPTPDTVVEEAIAVPVDVSAIVGEPEEEARVVTLEAPAIEDLEVVEEIPPVEEAIAPAAVISLPAEPKYLKQQQLAKLFGISRQAVAKLEKSGTLAERGWERVPGMGGTKKNPIRYRPISG